MTASPRVGDAFDVARDGHHVHDVVSPVTGRTIDRVRLASSQEICRTVEALAGPPVPPQRHEVLAFLGRLRDQLVAHRDALVETTTLETGFIRSDSQDIVAAAIEFLRDFGIYAESQQAQHRPVPHSYSTPSPRAIHIAHRPYRWVAAMVPQNASLTLCITILASASYAGSRVLLRPSLQCGASGALLAELVKQSEPPNSVVIVNCLASEFLDASFRSEQIDVMHYIGSNRYTMRVLSDAMAARKQCLIDGQGNGLLYVDDSVPLDEAVQLITAGATRFNGLTCTSINGVLAHEAVFPALRDALAARFREFAVGDPRDPQTQIGPLFSAEHAAGLAADLRANASTRLLCGGEARGTYFTPAVAEVVSMGDPLVREGLFGPALWIQPVREDSVFDWLGANAFPLSDTVLSARPEVVEAFAFNSRAARICVNEDPSVESMFEPWGGYPPSGLNPVSIWIEKYRQAYQLDGRSSMLATPFRVLAMDTD